MSSSRSLSSTVHKGHANMDRLAYAAGLLTLVALTTAVQAAGPLDPSLFYQSPKSTSILPPNPAYPTCLVVIDYAITNSNTSTAQAPTAEQVPTVVFGNLSLQVASLSSTGVKDSFKLLVDVLKDVNFTASSQASIGAPVPGNSSSGLHTIPLSTSQSIGPNDSDSVFINTTVAAGSQDFLPRAIFLQEAGGSPGACSLSLRSEHIMVANPFAAPPG